MRTLALVVALAACGSSTKSSTEPEPAAGTLLDCAKVAEHVATTVDASKRRSGITHGPVKEMVSIRCETDAWSDETKQCLYAIKTVQEGRACATGMTDVQRTALKAHAKSLRPPNGSASEEDDHSGDWIKHVVEE
jgi:hypothetical protein